MAQIASKSRKMTIFTVVRDFSVKEARRIIIYTKYTPAKYVLNCRLAGVSPAKQLKYNDSTGVTSMEAVDEGSRWGRRWVPLLSVTAERRRRNVTAERRRRSAAAEHRSRGAAAW